MALPEIASCADWLQARKKLLEAEKALTQRGYAVHIARRNLPMVRVESDFRFAGTAGGMSIATCSGAAADRPPLQFRAGLGEGLAWLQRLSR